MTYTVGDRNLFIDLGVESRVSCRARERKDRYRPVEEELVRAGIPKEDIVLAEKPAEVRPFTGYGVG